MSQPDLSYHQLADLLVDVVRRRRPGDRMPSEHELVERHGVSRITARAALQELEQRHLVRRVRGSGTFVSLRLDYPISPAGPPSFSEVVRRAGRRPGHVIGDIRTVRPPRPVRDALVLRPDARTIRVRRRGLVDDAVVSHQTHWLPADLVGDLRRNLERRGSLFDTLVADYDLHPRRFWNRAELATVPADIAPALGFGGRPQAWWIESCNRCVRTGRIVELSSSWVRADAFRIRFEHGPSDGITVDSEDLR